MNYLIECHIQISFKNLQHSNQRYLFLNYEYFVLVHFLGGKGLGKNNLLVFASEFALERNLESCSAPFAPILIIVESQNLTSHYILLEVLS